MDAIQILALDYENRSLGCNGFLLQLAGFSVTAVSNIAEALNWASCCQETSHPFALMTASNLPATEIGRTIRLLQRAGVSLPLLLVNREIQTGSDKACETSELGSNVFFCHPEQIVPAARHITNTEVVSRPSRQRSAIAINS